MPVSPVASQTLSRSLANLLCRQNSLLLFTLYSNVPGEVLHNTEMFFGIPVYYCNKNSLSCLNFIFSSMFYVVLTTIFFLIIYLNMVVPELYWQNKTTYSTCEKKQFLMETRFKTEMLSTRKCEERKKRPLNYIIQMLADFLSK